MEMLRSVLSDDESKPMSPRTRELLRRIIAIVIVVLGMGMIIWDANAK